MNVQHPTFGIERSTRAWVRPAGGRGFTLVELIVVLVSVTVVVMFAMAIRPRARGEDAWRIKCGSNLRQIGMAAHLYAADNHGQFPRTRYDPADPTPRFYTNPLSIDPFGAQGPEANDVTAAWFLLLRYTDLQPQTFLCPLTEHGEPLSYVEHSGKNDKRSMSNFPDRRYLGYSFANPYPSAELGDWNWSTNRSSTFPLAADINPGATELLAMPVTADTKSMRRINSPNHRGEGQNVLFADGSVRYTTTPFEGVLRDNIYTAGRPPDLNTSSGDGVAIISPPLNLDDSVLLPVATGEPVRARLPRSEAIRRLWLHVVLPASAGLGLTFGLFVVFANRSRQGRLERGELPEMPQ